jgi:hypothetical protein
MALIIFLTLLFNLTVLTTLARKPEIRKRGSNWWSFIVSLSVADVTVAVFVMPFRLVHFQLVDTW